MNTVSSALLGVVLLALASAAPAHEDEHPKKRASGKTAAAPEETAFGRAGDPGKITRTVDVTMDDRMRFVPDQVAVRRGDTIRFRVKNEGKVMHEFVLGTMKDLKAHAELMRKHPGMEHDEPYMAHAAPGKSQVVVWQFTKPGEYHFACLMPGHFEAGMVGRVDAR
jgi:uncharacterized cupredoxin-like copper-binding protein